MKKHNHAIRDLIYLHLHQNERYVISYGIEFFEFARSQFEIMQNLLLLKHAFDDGEFNVHTLLEYVPFEKLSKIIEDDVYGYGDFCWIDFDEEEGLNQLSDQNLAELLFLGHHKHHLKSPFYNQMNNRFVYLAHDDGWFNKTYYRNLNDFYNMLGDVLSYKMSKLRLEKSLLGMTKKRVYPSVDKAILLAMKDLMREGIVLSFKKIVQTRGTIEIPIWIVGDYANMDDMHEEYELQARSKSDATLIFDKKTREWELELS